MVTLKTTFNLLYTNNHLIVGTLINFNKRHYSNYNNISLGVFVTLVLKKCYRSVDKKVPIIVSALILGLKKKKRRKNGFYLNFYHNYTILLATTQVSKKKTFNFNKILDIPLECLVSLFIFKKTLKALQTIICI